MPPSESEDEEEDEYEDEDEDELISEQTAKLTVSSSETS